MTRLACSAHHSVLFASSSGHLGLLAADFRRATKLRELDLQLLAREIRWPASQAPAPEWLHAFWSTVAAHAPAAALGIGATHLKELTDLFGPRRKLLPLASGEVVALEDLATVLALPEGLASTPLVATPGSVVVGARGATAPARSSAPPPTSGLYDADTLDALDTLERAVPDTLERANTPHDAPGTAPRDAPPPVVGAAVLLTVQSLTVSTTLIPVDEPVDEPVLLTVQSLLATLAMPLLAPAFVRAPGTAPRAISEGAAAAAAAAIGIAPKLGQGYFAADASDEAQLAGALIDKIGSAHSAGVVQWGALHANPANTRALVATIARAHAARGGQRLLSPSRKAVLGKLPIFETCVPDEMVMRGAGRAEARGSEGARAPETTRFVSLDEPRYLLGAPHPLFTPSAAQAVHFLAHDDAPAPVLALLEDLGVRRLEDHDVCELFVLPTFSSLALSKQRAVREHLLRHWQAFRQHDRLREALRTTPFVPVGEQLLRPSEVLDPRVDVLSYIFGGESVFPEAECCTDEWLAMLAALGMRTSIDRNAFLECARKVSAAARSQSFTARSQSFTARSQSFTARSQSFTARSQSFTARPQSQLASAQHGVLPPPPRVLRCSSSAARSHSALLVPPLRQRPTCSHALLCWPLI